MAKASKEIIQKHEQMFYPTVRVRTKKAGGSGTVVYSENYNDEVYTYVITNHHVISDSVHIEKKWDPVLKRKVDKEILDTVYVEFFRYNNYSHTVGSFAVEADIVAYSEVDGGQDWALLRVRDKENQADYVANMFPLDDIENVHIFDDCFAVGASLGHPPVASNGMITYMDDEIDHYKYWMSSAQTIFGNSGGAVYRWSPSRKKYEYVLISIKKDSNLNKLILKIKSKLKNKFTTTEDILITRERHRQNLLNCVQHLEKFLNKLNGSKLLFLLEKLLLFFPS